MVGTEFYLVTLWAGLLGDLSCSGIEDLWQHLFVRLYLAKRLMVDAVYFLSTSKAHGPKQDASFLNLNTSELEKSLFQGSWSGLEIDVTSIPYCSALQERPCFLRC